MATHLVSLVIQFLTPDMIGRIATALGLDRNSAQTAIGAGVPGLLAGLMGVASQPGGLGAVRSFADAILAAGIHERRRARIHLLIAECHVIPHILSILCRIARGCIWSVICVQLGRIWIS